MHVNSHGELNAGILPWVLCVCVCSSGALVRTGGSSASELMAELHRFQLERWKLSFTSTIPTLSHRVTVLNIKDQRRVKKNRSFG